MKPIPLTKGKVAWVDDIDYEELSRYKWQAIEGRRTWYARRSEVGTDRNIYMHRQIMNASEVEKIDHENGDGLLNVRQNLRRATHSQNLMNRGKTKRNTSGHKGISWDKVNKKWEAKIGLNGKTIHLGRFSELEKAILVRAEAARKHHGEFANLTN